MSRARSAALETAGLSLPVSVLRLATSPEAIAPRPDRAVSAPTAAAANFAAPARDARLLMISTDNVFDGSRPGNAEDAPVSPANAYGRAKLRAERTVLAGPADAVVLRVSLVHGHEPADAGKWLDFFASCAYRLLRGEPVRVPQDQWTTPVLVDDVAEVTAAVLEAGTPLPPVLHLGGPDRVSRAAWASVVAEALGAPPHLVVPVPRAATRYASRPENACLTGSLLRRLPATKAISVRGRAGGRLRPGPGVRGRPLSPPSRAGPVRHRAAPRLTWAGREPGRHGRPAPETRTP
jgi:dTDP-4-dehydrorhamnose reductase